MRRALRVCSRRRHDWLGGVGDVELRVELPVGSRVRAGPRSSRRSIFCSATLRSYLLPGLAIDGEASVDVEHQKEPFHDLSQRGKEREQ